MSGQLSLKIDGDDLVLSLQKNYGAGIFSRDVARLPLMTLMEGMERVLEKKEKDDG